MILPIKLYYTIKVLIPRWLQILFRRKLVRLQLKRCSSVWPIKEDAGKEPEGWVGWPDGKQFAVVLTHDVEWERGQKRVRKLAHLEMQCGFRSSFNFVPERYPDDPELRSWLLNNSFEIGVHDLKHNGKLFSSRSRFEKSVPLINRYIQEWKTEGFRAGAMHHNLEWISGLDITYDASTFDTDPFEPQADGVNTIFPFWYASSTHEGKGFVELPYTLIQDFTLFVIMQEKTNRIWKEKLAWIAEKGGMAMLIVHPDYINMEKEKQSGMEEYDGEVYLNFLDYIRTQYKDRFWNPLPCEVAGYIKKSRNLLQTERKCFQSGL